MDRLRLEQRFLDQSLDRWILAGSTVVIVMIVFGLVVGVARRKCARLPLGSGRRLIYSILASPKALPMVLLAFAGGAAFLELPPAHRTLVRILAIIGGGAQIGLLGQTAIRVVIERETARRRARNQSGLSSLGIIRLLGQTVIWSLVILSVMNNLGVDITGLVASLGVGGIAVALAAQNVLGDLFASLSIVLDRPFEVGDFIVVGDEVGSVQDIGLKSTRVRALSGEEIVVGNADLLKSRIRNFKKMEERRVVVRFGVLYSSKPELLRRIPDTCRRAVERRRPRARFDRAHLDVFGPSALEFELVYYVDTNDFDVHMDIKQAILLEIFEALPRLGLALAFPTTTVHLASVPERVVLKPTDSENGRAHSNLTT